MLNFASKLLVITVLVSAIFNHPAIASVGIEEVLLGVNLTEKDLELHVASNGCTTEENFLVDINYLVDIHTGNPGIEPVQLKVIRIKPDTCKALVPEGVTIKFSRETYKLNGKFAMTLLNKIGTTSKGI